VILAAALLVLLGLALFVGGVLTDITVLYWLCVATCVAAGVFLVLARVRMGRGPATSPGPTVGTGAASTPATDAVPATATDATSAPAEEPAATVDDGPATTQPSGGSAEEPATAAAHPSSGASGPAAGPAGDPPVEDVEVTDLLLVVDLRDDVLVVDEHPRYHLQGCRWLSGRETVPLPLDEARTDGFTPCAWCAPDRTLAERERGRRAGRNS